MDLSVKRKQPSSPPPAAAAKPPPVAWFAPPRLSSMFTPTMPKFSPVELPPPPSHPSTRLFTLENFLMYRDMMRKYQLQSQLSQHPMVCSSSNNSTTNNNNSNLTTNACPSTTTTTTAAAVSESMLKLRNNLIEIFPSITISKDEEDVKFLSRDNFKNHAAQAYPFIQFKFDNSDYISYYGLENCSSSSSSFDSITDKIEDDKRERLYRLLKASKVLDERTGNENVAWTKLDDIFKKLPVSFRKKKTTTKTGVVAAAVVTSIKTNREKHREEHADTRLGFRFDNMFLVKRFFTFGERIVNPDEVHIIQTCEVPILYNELKEEHYRNKRKISQSTTTTSSSCCSSNVYNEKFDGLFDPMDQKYYNTYVLNPHTIYMVPSNTIYILITMQKTLFSIDRVDVNKYQKMRIEDFRWSQVDIYPPQTHKQLQIQLPPSGNPVVVCKNVKRKKLLDNEKKWIYNDVLNPPQIFTQPKQIIIEGEDEEIQFNNPYFYFEPNNQYYHHQQQQNYLMSNGELNETIVCTPTIYSSSTSSSPQQQEEQEQQNDLMSNSENNDEMIINTTPPQQQQQQIYSNDDEFNNFVVENLECKQQSPRTSLNENVEINQTNITPSSPLKESSNLSEESTFPPQNDKNVKSFDFDDIYNLPPLSVQQNKEYEDIMDQLNSFADNYVSSNPPPSCENNDEKNPIQIISFEDVFFKEPEQQQQQPEIGGNSVNEMFDGNSSLIENKYTTSSFDNNSTNILDSNISSPPPENVINDCNKLLEDLNNFAKNCFQL